jgi:MFS family permease
MWLKVGSNECSSSMTFIGPLSLHLFIPAKSGVKEGALGVSTGMAQLTMSLAMMSMAFFTVAYGGLSDRFGRKRVLLGGLVLLRPARPPAWSPPTCRCCSRDAF